MTSVGDGGIPTGPDGGGEADVLREAASLMRRRARATTPGAAWTDGHYWITDYDPSDPSGQTAMQREIGGMGPDGDAQHYSSWIPPVAFVIADWLDVIANGAGLDLTYHADEAYALRVARTYLDEDNR